VVLIATLVSLVLLGQVGDDPLDRLAADGRWEELRDAADGRLAKDPSDQTASYWLGRDLLAQGLELAAGNRIARDLARSTLDRAVEHLERVRQQSGTSTGDAVDWWLEARWARTSGAMRFGSGGGELPTRLARDTEALWEQEQLPMAAFVRGLLAEALGESDALPWFERASSADPTRSRFLQRLALAQAGAGQEAEALASYDRASAGAAAWLQDLVGVLSSLLPGRRDAGARAQRLDALAREPAWANEALLAWHRAHALHQLGDGPGALAAFEAGRDGRTADIDRAHASHLMAADRPADALALLLPRVRERDWTSLDDALGAIARLAGLRRHDEALVACDALLAVEPRHESALWNRALILWKSGRDDDAQRAFDDLIERLPGRSDALNDGALAAWGSGRMERARELLERAVALPGAIDARENLALLLKDVDAPRAASLLDEVLAAEPDRARALVARHDLRITRQIGG
jgi:tetratricopeptide (TPR) repeat protein